jgi:MFS family permease
MSGSDAPLLLAGAAEFRAYPARWWMVGALSLVALMQGGVWNTWSPIAPAMAQLFGWGDGTLALLANWGPISYCIAVFPNSWAMDERGLRPAVLAAAGLVFGGCLARCFTTDAGSATSLIHAGQFLNGLAGPVAMSAAPVLSAAWFPAHERRTATALVESMNMLGVAISFVAGPYLVPPVAQADLPPGPGAGAAGGAGGDPDPLGAGKLFFTSKDAGLVVWGKPDPFPTPIHAQPDMGEGASFMLYDNIWNTNYVFWWPFETPGKNHANIGFRFGIKML